MNACRPLLLLAALTLCGCDAAPMVKADKWTPSFNDRWQPALRLLDRPQLFLRPPPARKTYNIRTRAA